MPQGLLAGLFVVHGLITTVIGVGALTDPEQPGLANTGSALWPTPLGRSWVIDGLHLGTGAALVGGLLWAASGLAFLVAALGVLGVPGLRDVWQPLGLGGGALGLLAMALYLHPWYAIGIAINVAVVALLSGGVRGATAAAAG
jgi:hypothetical protein